MSSRRIGVALSGGGHRASVWGAGALLALTDVGVAADVESVASVSGGSITNGLLAANGNYREATSNSFTSLLADAMPIWARRGLFARGPLTDRYTSLTLGMAFLTVPAMIHVLPVSIAAGRGVPVWGCIVGGAIYLVLALALAVKLARSLQLARLTFYAMAFGALCAGGWGAATLLATRTKPVALVGVFALTVVLVLLTWRQLGKRGPVVEAAIDTMLSKTSEPIQLKSNSPVHHVFCTTELNQRWNLYLTNRVVHCFNVTKSPTVPTTITIGRAIQSSACLPGGFLARDFAPADLPTAPPLPQRVLLSDGGVYDNMADQWDLDLDNRLRSLPPGTQQPVTHLVVANSSSSTDVGDTRVKVGLRSEIKSLLGAKDVQYRVSTSHRRGQLIERFDRARAHPELSDLNGAMIHIDTTPHRLLGFANTTTTTFPAEVIARSAAMRTAFDTVDPYANDPRSSKAAWADLAHRNGHVRTTLGPIGTDAAADLLLHAWTLTRVSTYVMLGWGSLPSATERELWSRERFRAIAASGD